MGLHLLSAKSADVHDFGMGEVVSTEFLPERAWLSGDVAVAATTTLPGVTTTLATDTTTTSEVNEVEVDHCVECKGIWLDVGELELLLEDCGEKEKLLASFEQDKTSKEKSRRCPICLKRMQKVLCGSEEKVLIDRCKKNHGLWFDEGELDEIIRMGSFGQDNRVLDLLKDMFGKR